MASNDTEIEIKIRLSKKEFNALKKKLEKTAKFVKSSYQLDEYFTPAHRNFLNTGDISEWLRIGKRDEKIILNYKHYYTNKNGEHTHCDEFETKVDQEEGLRKIFKALDFKKLIRIEKERDVYVYENDFEIALDKVTELGYFVEIESLKDFGSVDKTRAKIFKVAEKLSINLSKIEHKGYPHKLMIEKCLIKE